MTCRHRKKMTKNNITESISFYHESQAIVYTYFKILLRAILATSLVKSMSLPDKFERVKPKCTIRWRTTAR